MKESNKKYKCYYSPPSPPKQSYPYVESEFEEKVRIFLGIVGEPQLSDTNFDVWRSVDLNKTINK